MAERRVAAHGEGAANEAEVLFTLLAERHERRSVMVMNDLVFSQWERIFSDLIATTAAVDRLVDVPSS